MLSQNERTLRLLTFLRKFYLKSSREVYLYRFYQILNYRVLFESLATFIRKSSIRLFSWNLLNFTKLFFIKIGTRCNSLIYRILLPISEPQSEHFLENCIRPNFHLANLQNITNIELMQLLFGRKNWNQNFRQRLRNWIKDFGAGMKLYE